MVIPWTGFPLSKLLAQVEPRPNAKYVRFETLLDPQQMPGQRDSFFDWPYVEGLRLDEAMHDLTILATGLYGKPLPPQDGAPFDWSYHGSTGSKVASPSSRLIWSKKCRFRLDAVCAKRVRFLRERQSRCVASTLVASVRAPHRRAESAQDDSVQRLCRSGRAVVHGIRSAKEFLMMIRTLKAQWLRIAVHVGAWIPFLVIVWDALTNQLGAEPIREIILRTGKIALILLALSLACTPANTLFGFRSALKVRRALGLYAFFYALAHASMFIGCRLWI